MLNSHCDNNNEKNKRLKRKERKKRCAKLDENPHPQVYEAIVGSTTPRSPVCIMDKLFVYATSRKQGIKYRLFPSLFAY